MHRTIVNAKRAFVLVAALASVAALGAAGAVAAGGQVAVPSGADIQESINANPEGTTFLLSAGTWSLSSTVVPKNGDVLVGAGEGQTIIRAAGGTFNGFDSKSTVANVQIASLTVQGFSAGIRTGSGWTVRDVEADYNVVGIKMYGDNVVLDGAWAHHNGQFGVHGTLSTGQQMLSSEVSYNHTDSTISSGYAGGAKWVNSTGLLVQGNNIHDNYGNGLWLDVDTQGATVTGNWLHDNSDEGLRIEISSSTLVEDNRAEGNGGEAIDLFNSRDNVVRDNVMSAPSSASYVYRVLGNGRKNAAGVEYVNANNRTEYNTITLVSTTQKTGVVRAAGTTYGNTFDYDTYHVPSLTPAYFKWWDGTAKKTVAWSAWLGSYGQDTNGSILTP
ncbi:MAG: right-handed parallel beta-helix repeat-containing protein [Actinobacteria bacterium]|nr:right-handed parallel beta-helix repeat-containing protein [Actinomycetota bacterium]